ncbi:MAG TPA: energy-coupling factor transporter ATPase [Anaerolineae bacterium]|nr:energy-coupling factor transporter ATPase [Anaerolineae bacterium]
MLQETPFLLSREVALTLTETPFIRIEGLHHTYQVGSHQAVAALRGVDLTIDAGEHVAIIGANGSGKSTLLRHLNALLLPTRGDVWIAGWNTRDADHLRDIRSTVGMVFQSPDSQIVASVVEEDIAFGPENLGVPADELRQRVDSALDTVGLSQLRHRASHLLSAGQKQRLAIGSALAMHPRCLVLDEATAMLDPTGRRQLQQTIRQLHQTGITIVTATHSMSEAAQAQRIIVLSKGQVALDGTPRSVFGQEETLRALEMDVPYPRSLARTITARVPAFPPDALTVTELVESIAAHIAQNRGGAR